MKSKFALLLATLLAGGSAVFARVQLPVPVAHPFANSAEQAPTMGPQEGSGPMTQEEVLKDLKKKDGGAQLKEDLAKRGVSFELDEEFEKKLRKGKATDEIVQAVKDAGPNERAAAAKAAAIAAGGLVLPAEETAEFKALQGELDPDKGIALAEAFAQKHPNSDAISYVYSLEAVDYENKMGHEPNEEAQRADIEKIVQLCQQSVQRKKDNFMALMMLAYYIPQPQYVNKHQGSEEKDLTEAESYCQQAFAAADALKKQPNESDADFERRKAGYKADLHADLGMIHLDRAQLGLMGLDMEELAKAEKEYRLAVADPAHSDAAAWFRLGDACRLQGKLDDAIAAFTQASNLGKGPLKQIADDQITKLKAQKSAGATAKP